MGEEKRVWTPARLEGRSGLAEGEALEEYYQRLVEGARGRIEWYAKGRVYKRRAAMGLRGLATGFAMVGGAAPLVKSLLASYYRTSPAPDWVGDLGYLLIYLGGAVLLADRVGGYSRGWVRYWMTQLTIEREGERFSGVWDRLCAGLPATKGGAAPGVGDFLEAADGFKKRLFELAEAESKEWAQDFQASLGALEGQLKGK